MPKREAGGDIAETMFGGSVSEGIMRAGEKCMTTLCPYHDLVRCPITTVFGEQF